MSPTPFFRLWNQAQHKPQCTGFDEDVGIEVEGRYSGTGNSRSWYQTCVGCTPVQVIVPTICTWIEQPNKTSSAWIIGIDAITCEEIAVRAGIAQVIETGLAPKSLRHNVVDVECLGSDDMWGVTILTTVARTLRDPLREGQGHVRH